MFAPPPVDFDTIKWRQSLSRVRASQLRSQIQSTLSREKEAPG